MIITDILSVIILFVLFGLFHSFFASSRVKATISAKAGNYFAFYRLFYNVSSVMLFALVYYLSPKPYVMVYDLPYPYDLYILIPQFLGILGFVYTLRFFNNYEFLGISQVIRYFRGTYSVNQTYEDTTLCVKGPFKLVRHPLYFFSIIFLAFRANMSIFYLTFLLCILIYFVWGSYYEEEKLVKRFGVQYQEYKKNVPRIFPIKLFM